MERRAIGLTLKDRNCMSRIREETYVDDIIDKVTRKQLACAGLTMR